MATPITAAHTDDEDNNKNFRKKGRDIKPLNEDELKKQLAKDKESIQYNNDMLAELAAKTAELAEQVKGIESPKARVLSLDEHGDVEPKDIFEEINKEGSIQTDKTSEPNPAVDLIRQKLSKLYQTEPDAEDEAREVAVASKRSKHQEFMYNLTTSGKSLADIQTEWHNYYVGLPDDEKHEVWQEFYRDQHTMSAYAKKSKVIELERSVPEEVKKQPIAKTKQTQKSRLSPIADNQTVSKVMNKVSANGQLKPVHHIKSLLFGLGLACIVGLAITFVFFNEVFVAPFISPSRTVSATPIIGDVDGAVSNEPKIIIPKINLEVPVVYGLNTVDEKVIQDGLEEGVVHYSSSPEPGQIGNVVVVGHSSNNILNSGKYKFAFVLLKRLENGDTFFVHKDGVRYTYKVFEKKIVPPTDVSVLGPSARENTITLITCDPPGTSINRLIVVAEQISPDPAGNTEATVETTPEVEQLPSNAPSMWSRLTGWL